MAQRVITVKVDDLTGEELDDSGQTIRFGWLGAEYEMDLSQKNVDAFAQAITPYVEKATRVGGRTQRGGKSSASTNGRVDTKAVRAWAASNGIELSSRGRVPADVIEKFKAAGN